MFSWLSYLLLPFTKVLIHYRTRKGLEDPSRKKERYGLSNLSRPQGRLIWFHAASVGETISLIPLLKNYKKTHPEQTILLSTTTVTACSIAEQRLEGICLHQYIPFDIAPWIARFLKHWQPNACVLVESEIWPNIINQVHARKIPLLLLNARLSDRSYQRWLRFRSLAKSLLSRFSLVLAPSALVAERLKSLGATSIKLMTHLKFASAPLPAPKKELTALKKRFETRPLWVAASTHPGEEEIILKAHQALKSAFPGLLTIIIPRHPKRANSIKGLCESQALVAEKRSDNIPHEQPDIYIADTIGELGLFFSLSTVVFIGGSLVPHGGHNPIEPALSGCAVLWGPYMSNFQEICAVLSSACYPLKDAEDLIKTLKMLLTDPLQAQAMGKKAKTIVQKQAKELPEITETIYSYTLVKNYG